LPSFQNSVFIPWADIEKITLYKITRSNRRVGRAGSYIKIVPHGVGPAGYAAVRRVNTWRLDPERLVAVAAATAPGVPVVDAEEIDPWVDADMERFLHLDSKQPGITMGKTHLRTQPPDSR
jgi:hypothetical protein